MNGKLVFQNGKVKEVKVGQRFLKEIYNETLIFYFRNCFLISCSITQHLSQKIYWKRKLWLILFMIYLYFKQLRVLIRKVNDSNIEIDQYIFDKYKIDSTTFFSQNQLYYASDLSKYKKIYKSNLKT